MFGQVHLIKDSWHVKLNRIYREDGWRPEEVTNLCPYFWLTIGMLITLPVLALANGIFILANFIADHWPKGPSKRIRGLLVGLFETLVIFVLALRARAECPEAPRSEARRAPRRLH